MESSQRQSPLFSTLPSEIRTNIYGQAFRGVTHISLKLDPLKILSWKCHKEDADGIPCHWSNPCWNFNNAHRRRDWVGEFDRDKIPATREAGWVALLCSCRAVYREAIELLYTEPHFHFPVAEGDDVKKFFNALSPHRRDAIETLSIDTRYTKRYHLHALSWNILGDFRGLKALRIDVRHLWFNSVKDVDLRALLRRLVKVREQVTSLRILELVFDGDEDDVWEEWKSVSERQGVTLVLKELTHMGRLEVSGDTLDFMGGYHFR